MSMEAKVMRISGHEFEKKMLCHKQVLSSFTDQATTNMNKFEE